MTMTRLFPCLLTWKRHLFIGRVTCHLSLFPVPCFWACYAVDYSAFSWFWMGIGPEFQFYHCDHDLRMAFPWYIKVGAEVAVSHGRWWCSVWIGVGCLWCISECNSSMRCLFSVLIFIRTWISNCVWWVQFVEWETTVQFCMVVCRGNI